MLGLTFRHPKGTARRTAPLATFPPDLLTDPWHGMTPQRFRVLLGGLPSRTQALALRLREGAAQSL